MSSDLYINLEWLPVPNFQFNNELKLAVCSKNPGFSFYKLSNYRLNINQLNTLSKEITKAHANDVNLNPLKPFNLGVLSNSTTSFIVQSLVSTAARYGFLLTIYEAPFDQVMQTALGEIDEFNGVKMDAILVAIDYKGLPVYKNKATRFGESSKDVHESLGYLNLIRTQLKQRYNAPCILQTCAHEVESFFGSFDIQVNNTSRQFISEFNLSLVMDIAGTDDFLLDVSAISETVGLSNWHDPAINHIAKLPFSPKITPLYADNICRIIAAMKGKSRRALVLDLDNTLWGGVIGDDGVDGIKIGNGDALGEAYLSVQNSILKLHERGIVLAVCSKNTDSIARTPFKEHSSMLVKEQHIASFQANWDDKASNIRSIANELNLGLDSIVFMDDNPMERDLVRKYLPQVAVPELPEDPSYFSRTLLAAGYFEAVHFSDEDKIRVEGYKANAKRTALRNTMVDLDSYLHSLEMKAEIQSFNEKRIKRIVQLISKTNQFNLTTHRYNEKQILNFLNNDSYYAIQVKLSDTFGDNGVVSIIICDKNSSEWVIDTWVMSCRVLGRRLEEFIFYEIVRSAKTAGVKRIVGIYIPTERNKITQDLYLKLGFTEYGDSTQDYQKWFIELNNVNFKNTPIELVS
ncbi:HAD-IIIC family phosphatase [bacterium]|jgi:FkbH-like protein|nr:HAD-IIIC family phosphatase [bacterium]